MKTKDPYLKRFRLHVSGLRNWLWGLMTLGLKYTQITHKVVVVDAKGNEHELYRKYRKIFYFPGKKFYSFRFRVFVPNYFGPTGIRLYHMHPGRSVFLLRDVQVMGFLGMRVPGWNSLYDTFSWKEISEEDED